jgi:hypothetical protein
MRGMKKYVYGFTHSLTHSVRQGICGSQGRLKKKETPGLYPVRCCRGEEKTPECVVDAPAGVGIIVQSEPTVSWGSIPRWCIYSVRVRAVFFGLRE